MSLLEFLIAINAQNIRVSLNLSVYGTNARAQSVHVTVHASQLQGFCYVCYYFLQLKSSNSL